MHIGLQCNIIVIALTLVCVCGRLNQYSIPKLPKLNIQTYKSIEWRNQSRQHAIRGVLSRGFWVSRDSRNCSNMFPGIPGDSEKFKKISVVHKIYNKTHQIFVNILVEYCYIFVFVEKWGVEWDDTIILEIQNRHCGCWVRSDLMIRIY